jgi:hypothetical protein
MLHPLAERVRSPAIWRMKKQDRDQQIDGSNGTFFVAICLTPARMPGRFLGVRFPSWDQTFDVARRLHRGESLHEGG